MAVVALAQGPGDAVRLDVVAGRTGHAGGHHGCVPVPHRGRHRPDRDRIGDLVEVGGPADAPQTPVPVPVAAVPPDDLGLDLAARGQPLLAELALGGQLLGCRVIRVGRQRVALGLRVVELDVLPAGPARGRQGPAWSCMAWSGASSGHLQPGALLCSVVLEGHRLAIGQGVLDLAPGRRAEVAGLVAHHQDVVGDVDLALCAAHPARASVPSRGLLPRRDSARPWRAGSTRSTARSRRPSSGLIVDLLVLAVEAAGAAQDDDRWAGPGHRVTTPRTAAARSDLSAFSAACRTKLGGSSAWPRRCDHESGSGPGRRG